MTDKNTILDPVNPVEYNWTSDYQDMQTGLIAQEIANANSVLVSTGSGTAWESPYTINTSNWSTSWSTSPMTVSPAATLDLQGEGADIRLNGESIVETLAEIKDALLIPRKINANTQLESEFKELKELRLEYERRVKEFQEKKKVWDILKD
jgi:hypothetical protein